MMFRVEDPELLLALHALYQFEAERTSGPHGGAPGFRPWSAEEVVVRPHSMVTSLSSPH